MRLKLIRIVRQLWTHPLNRGARMRALSRFLRWQMASRLVSAPIMLPFVNHTSLVTERHMTGLTGNYYNGLMEADEMGFVLHALRPDDLFVDVGANAGSFTVLAAGAVGARVVAFEPLPATFERLVRNVRANGLDERVEAHCQGIGAEKGVIDFTSDFDTVNRVVRAGESVRTVPVPVDTLDVSLAGKSPAIVKIDVEGFEKWVLAGAGKTLSSRELLAVIMETNGSGAAFGVADATLFEMMAAHGLNPVGYNAIDRRIAAYQQGQANTIFIRDPSRVEALCRTAPRFQLVTGSI